MERPEMRRRLKPLKLWDALDEVINSIDLPLSSEVIEVSRSIGRILAEDIKADSDYPPFNEIFYDGYALISDDVANASEENPVRLKIVGRMDNEDRPDKIILKQGETAFVTCGSPIPVNADTSIRLEAVEVKDGYIIVKKPVKKGENIVFRGSQYKRGELIFHKGHLIRPQDIGLLMELNISRVKVLRKVRVGIVAVGTELLDRLKKGVIYPDNYSQTAKHILDSYGFDVIHLGIIDDDYDKIRDVILNSIRFTDVLLIVGGVSVSSNDLVPDVVEDIGKLIFHGLGVRPGKVTGFGVVKDRPVFLIPGHIGSTLAAIFLLVIPALMYKIRGDKDPYMKIYAELVNKPDIKPGLYSFRTVSLRYGDGRYYAKIINKPLGGSPFLSIFTEANGFILIDPKKIPDVGDMVEVRLFTPYEVNYIR